MHVCGGIGSGGFSSLFVVSACCWRGMLRFGKGKDRGFVLYIFLFLGVLGWCVKKDFNRVSACHTGEQSLVRNGEGEQYW